MEIIGGNVTHGGEIDLSLTPPANFVGSETLTVTAHVVDTGNGSQNQSIPVTFNVTVTPLEPAGSTADMIMRDNNGNYEIYDFGNNVILAAGPLGQVGVEWQVAGLGGFYGTDTSDMLLRNGSTGDFDIYDISNNTITNSRRHGPSRTGMAGRGLRRFQLARRRNRHADAQQQHAEIRDLRHQQQRHHLCGADGPGRSGMVGGGLRRFLDGGPTKPTC